MKDIMKQQSESLRTVGPNQQNKVVIGGLKKTTEHLNSNGDVIDPVTKAIIKRNADK